MELGNKIKALRLKAGLTQEMLAEELGVTFQTISKWENNVCAPDIAMLPKISIYFGVTIDELFDLSVEQKLHRIENMLDVEHELSQATFNETVDFLQEQLDGEYDKARICAFLAHVYHHRVVSDCEKVKRYAGKSLQLRPGIKDCQWLFIKADGAVAWDWNVRNHHRIISFYKELIERNPKAVHNYLHLMDNLLADNRTKEAAECLERYKSQLDHKDFHVLVYEGRIAMAEHDVDLAKRKFVELEEKYSESGMAMFELANYYADQCEYDRAIICYEKSFALDKEYKKVPLYTDALQGMAMIYEIQEKYEDAVKCYDRILKVLDEEFGFTEGEPVRLVEVEKQRLLDMILQNRKN